MISKCKGMCLLPGLCVLSDGTCRNDYALVLFSYLPPDELESTESTPYRTYAIASFIPAGDALDSQRIDKVPYEGVSTHLRDF